MQSLICFGLSAQHRENLIVQSSYNLPMLRSLRPTLLAVSITMLIGAVLIIAAGVNPLVAYWQLLVTGFGCSGSICSLLTTLQYATPLILSGLAALLAFRVRMFSLGQLGQMILGAGFATMIANQFSHVRLVALWACLAAMIGGAIFSWIPGYLKNKLNVSEIIVSILLNPMALVIVGPFSFRRIPELARLAPLFRGSKLNVGFFFTLIIAALVFVFLWRTRSGYVARMAGEAPRFAHFGGIHSSRAILNTMLLSGSLAGLAGAIEVLGVQYRFVSQFSSVDAFDGVMVALIGQLHPLGVVLGGVVLGGVRLGALNGLQMQASVPRELGAALIAIAVLILSVPGLYHWLEAREIPAE